MEISFTDNEQDVNAFFMQFLQHLENERKTHSLLTF